MLAATITWGNAARLLLVAGGCASTGVATRLIIERVWELYHHHHHRDTWGLLFIDLAILVGSVQQIAWSMHRLYTPVKWWGLPLGIAFILLAVAGVWQRRQLLAARRRQGLAMERRRSLRRNPG